MHKQEIVVAVTGGAPYTKLNSKYDFNTSAMIRDALPNHIIRKDASTINIVKYPGDVPCIYGEVLSIISQLWNKKRSVYYPGCAEDETINVDLMLHLGMRPSKDHCSLETFARWDGYEKPGEDGKRLEPGVWAGLPEELEPGFDIEDVVSRMAKALPNIPVETSKDAGLYFCEFQLYASLAELHIRNDFARAAFMHVPASRSESDIQRTVKLVMAIIVALVEGLDAETLSLAG